MNTTCALPATLPPPDPLVAEPHTQARILYPYGVGIDTHSKFIQVCVLYQHDTTVRQAEKEFPTTWQAIIEAKLWALSTYLGHRHLAHTYWYLSAVPELMHLCQQRFATAQLWASGGTHHD